MNDKERTCAWIQGKLCDYPDNLSVVPCKLVTRHLGQCHRCRQIFQENTMLKQALRQPLLPPSSLRKNLLQQFRQTRIEPERCRKSPVKFWLVYRAAAVILIVAAIALTTLFGYRPRNDGQEQPVSKPLVFAGEYTISVSVDKANPEAAVVRLQKNDRQLYPIKEQSDEPELAWQVITIHYKHNNYSERKFVQGF